MNKAGLSVVVPTFGELDNIRVLCPWIARVVRRANIRSEIVVVDDDSGDGTEQWADGRHDWVGDEVQFRFIGRKAERGLVSAWQRGVAEATANVIAIMDADLCHDPGYLPLMWESLAGNDMVIGSRYLPGRLAQMPDKSWLAVALSRCGQKLCRGVLGLSYRDMSHSFRMFGRSSGGKALGQVLCKGNAAMVEHLCLLHKAGGRIVEIPVSYGKRIHGKTKLRVGREGIGLLKTLLRLRLNNERQEMIEYGCEQV